MTMVHGPAVGASSLQSCPSSAAMPVWIPWPTISKVAIASPFPQNHTTYVPLLLVKNPVYRPVILDDSVK